MPEALIDTVERIDAAGAGSYLVGGAVRDLVCAREPHDYDLVTTMPLDGLKKIFSQVEQGRGRHELARVYWKNHVFEFTQLPAPSSQNGAIMDMLSCDASTRDFRLNSIFYDLASDSLIDPAGGLSDIAARCVRTVERPDHAIERNPLIMARAARICHRLGFGIDARLLETASARAADITRISADRLLVEMQRHLFSGHARANVESLHQIGLLRHVWPAVDVLFTRPQTAAYVNLVLRHLDDDPQERLSVSFPEIASYLLWGHLIDCRKPADFARNIEHAFQLSSTLELKARFGAGVQAVLKAQYDTAAGKALLHASPPIRDAARRLSLMREKFQNSADAHVEG